MRKLQFDIRITALKSKENYKDYEEARIPESQLKHDRISIARRRFEELRNYFS
ncbi:MAG: hypothetical protein GX660_08780 [Clostridiaceae bacterium]|nr:hypothetical protein [Clostridiaceae bacterium]